MITSVLVLARRAVTGDTNLAMTGTGHLKSSLAERWSYLELVGCNLTETKSPTQNSPSLLPASYLAATLGRAFFRLDKATSQNSLIL
jgi:hypothetical protein